MQIEAYLKNKIMWKKLEEVLTMHKGNKMNLKEMLTF